MNIGEMHIDAASIGIDIGGTKTLGVLLSDQGTPLAQLRFPTPTSSVKLVELILSIYSELSHEVPDGVVISSLGIGVAGLVDMAGELRCAPNLSEADGLRLGELIGSSVDVAVYLDNDANCAALAEIRLGVAKDIDNAFLVTLGTGIGGAVVVNGKVYRGGFGLAGEPGHMLVDPEGIQCACGARGCWEAYASGSGLRNLALRRVAVGELSNVVQGLGGKSERITGELISYAASAGDQEAIAVVDEYAKWVALGLANCAALLDPEMIILGGGIVESWQLFGPRICDLFDDFFIGSQQRTAVQIKPAKIGEAAGAVGASLLATVQSPTE